MKWVERISGILGSALRLFIALWLISVCREDQAVLEARRTFEELPAYDAASEASHLFNENRFTEALLLVEEALEADADNPRLLIIKQGIEIERTNWIRTFAQGGRGALTGEVTDAASATGAIVADLFVFGDVRDLIVQTGHWLEGEETDEVIIALSAGGILLTVSPQMDFGAALLKTARRMGALSDAFAKSIVKTTRRAVETRSAKPVADLTSDVASLSKRTTPSGTVAILKHVDDPATLKVAREFAQTVEGRHALMLDPQTSLRWLKSGWKPARHWLTRAAGKGRAGLRYLAENSSLMFKAHPLLGLVKGLYKGNIPFWLSEMVREWSTVILGFLYAWASFEGVMLLSRLVALVPGGWLPRRASAPKSTGHGSPAP